jgi:hypothetical protein
MSTHETLAALTTDDRSRGPTTNRVRSERWAPLAGVLFTVAFAVGFLSAGDSPAVDASGREVIAHYDDAGSILAGVVAAPIAAVGLLVFAGVLRNRLRAEGREWLATVAFGGAAVYAAGLGLFATTQLALLDAADLGQPEVAQALNIFHNDNFMPVVVGLAVTLVATGWHAVTSRSLPSWLGRITLALGVLAVAGPAGFVAFLLFPIWVLVTAVTLLRQHPDPVTHQESS